MEEALRKLNVPYKIYGGLSFYQRKEIKDLIAYFRLTFNPNDEEAIKRVINYPRRGIGDTSLERIIIAADQHNLTIWDIICEAPEISGFPNCRCGKHLCDHDPELPGNGEITFCL